jgi:uncharacterized protein
MHEANVVATEWALRLKKLTSGWRVRLVLVALAALLVIGLVVYRFSPKQHVSADCAFRIADSSVSPETKGDAHVLDTCVQLEETSTNSERVLGLSGRQSMPRNRGMLFDFSEPAEYCMWMKDMHFALDMVWLNDQKEIIYMIEGVTPETYPKSFCGPKTAQYVVEVGSGVVKSGDLHVGQHLRF